MKYLKYFILVVVVIIIIIITILLIMNKDTYIETDEVEETELNIETNQKVSVTENRNNYYLVKKIVEDYYNDLMQFNISEDDIMLFGDDASDSLQDILEEERKASKNKVYNYLDKNYIQKNSISIDNIQSKLGNYNDVVVLIDNIYYANDQVRVYFVNGNVVEKSSLKKSQFSIMVSTDTQNTAFEIYPNGYDYKIELGKELKIDKKEIINTKYNNYTYNIINDETYSKDIFDDYKNRLMYDVEGSFNRLDEEYRKAKFTNLEEYKKYVKDNYTKLINSNLSSYQVTNTQVLCIDRNNKSYIFKITAPMQYSLILDTYTIDIPEFTTKYNGANDKEKVILNINKFMLALNDKDYKYAYNILANSFKQKNFPTFESFEKYAKSNFFDQNKFDYLEFGDEAGTYYTYKVSITDATGKNNKSITKTFIMKLNEGTKFETSFNI